MMTTDRIKDDDDVINTVIVTTISSLWALVWFQTIFIVMYSATTLVEHMILVRKTMSWNDGRTLATLWFLIHFTMIVVTLCSVDAAANPQDAASE
jgi:hypothetical protein